MLSSVQSLAEEPHQKGRVSHSLPSDCSGLDGRFKTAPGVGSLTFYIDYITVEDDCRWKGNSGLGVFSSMIVSTV